jgi:hypothetical protein
MANPNPNFDTIASATLRNYSKNLIENILGHNVLFWQLKERGFRGVEQGGTSITFPIMHGTNSTVQAYSGYDVLDVTPQTGFTTIELGWKYLSVSITISGQEEFENSGSKSKIFDLLEGKIKQAELSLRLDMNRQLFGDGTGQSSKEITGLGLAVEDGTAWSTYAGIDSSANAFWRNKYLDKSGVAFADTLGASTEGIAAMRNMYNSCTLGNSKPTLIVTTQDLYEAYEANAEGQKLQITAGPSTSAKLMDLGFTNILFKGVPIVFDEDCDDDTMLFLNSEFLKLVVGKGREFVTSEFVKPENQDAKVARIGWTGNLVCTKRDQQGRLVIPAA